MMLTHMPEHDARSICGYSCSCTAMLGCQELCTDGRTDGLTEKHPQLRSNPATSYRARTSDNFADSDGLVSLAELLISELPALFATRERWPLLRLGNRAYIPAARRRLVLERDANSCRWCGSPRTLQLDHVQPWSAYGSDDSSNLRVLCEPCNSERSNYVDPAERPQIPVTTACYWCSIEWWERRGFARDDIEFDDENRVIRAYCGTCGLTSWVPAESWLA